MNLKDYDLEIENILEQINKTKAKKVLLQFPDGLKPHAGEICDKLKQKSKTTQFFIYGGTNFGACDLPQGMEQIGIDLLINFGHNQFGLNEYINYKNKKIK